MDSGSPGEGLVLAASFPLLHNSSTAGPTATALPPLYNPTAAASEEWPARLTAVGVAVAVTPGDPHHVKVTLQGAHLHVTPSPNPLTPALLTQSVQFLGS